MKILYFDCTMGAAGDMLTAALAHTLDEPQAFVREFNALGIPHVRLAIESSTKRGVTGLHARMLVHEHEEHEHKARAHHQHHRSLGDVSSIISSLPLDEKTKSGALGVYRLIAGAESVVHGEAVELVHFHEVGALDAIADVVAFSMLVGKLAPDRIYASHVNTGWGSVKCAHGILPVPAPATAELLRGIPNCAGDIRGELCTPTGAALLKHFVTGFGSPPMMTVSGVGYGMGQKDFPLPNCVRAHIGYAQSPD